MLQQADCSRHMLMGGCRMAAGYRVNVHWYVQPARFKRQCASSCLAAVVKDATCACSDAVVPLRLADIRGANRPASPGMAGEHATPRVLSVQRRNPHFPYAPISLGRFRIVSAHARGSTSHHSRVEGTTILRTMVARCRNEEYFRSGQFDETSGLWLQAP